MHLRLGVVPLGAFAGFRMGAVMRLRAVLVMGLIRKDWYGGKAIRGIELTAEEWMKIVRKWWSIDEIKRWIITIRPDDMTL